MTTILNVRGTLDQLIKNDHDLYEGNLVRYFQIIFYKSKNLNNPYHNFRHMMYVTWQCHQACNFYVNTLTKRERRNLLIAAMFHDFDHSGTTGDDLFNIMLAIQGLNKYILPEDQSHQKDIAALIHATEYPYKMESSSLSLCEQIIRDADLSQALNPVWLQQVIFGLASEWNKSPLHVLKMQNDFHRKLNFTTVWAQETWPKSAISNKIDETTHLLEILERVQ